MPRLGSPAGFAHTGPSAGRPLPPSGALRACPVMFALQSGFGPLSVAGAAFGDPRPHAQPGKMLTQ